MAFQIDLDLAGVRVPDADLAALVEPVGARLLDQRVGVDCRRTLDLLAIDHVGVAVSSARGCGTWRCRSWHNGGRGCRGGRGFGDRYGPRNRHARNGSGAVHDRTVPRADESGVTNCLTEPRPFG